MSAPDTPRHAYDLSTHKLRKLLDSQAHSQVLAFPDAFLGDSPCGLLTQYMLENPYVTSLDLKGNNLTTAGIQALAGVFRPPCRLETANLEWNSIGVGGGKGLEVLASVLSDNDSLVNLDLRNNKIGPEGAAALSALLKSNTTLQVLDLRWNEIGPAGGRSLLAALQSNKSLKSLELAGNKVPDDVLQRIEGILSENRQNRPSTAEPQYRVSSLAEEERLNQSMSMGRSEARPSDADTLVEQERKRFREMRSELVKELEQEKALRAHIEASLVALKEETMRREAKDSKITEQLEMRLSEANHEKAEIASELAKTRDFLEKTNESHQEKLKAFDYKIAQLMRNNAQNEEVIRSDMEKLRLEHSLEKEQMQKEWERRAAFSEEQFAKVKSSRDELDDIVKTVKSQLIAVKADHETALKLTEDRVRDETEKRLLQQLKLQEQKMGVMDENKVMLQARIEALQQEVAKSDRKHQEVMMDIEQELVREREDKGEIALQMRELQGKVDQMQAELTLRGSQIETLNAQLSEKEAEIGHVTQLQEDQRAQLTQEAAAASHSYQASLAHMTARIGELERQLKNAQAEVVRVKQEHDRLGEAIKRSLGALVDAKVTEHVKRLTSALQH